LLSRVSLVLLCIFGEKRMGRLRKEMVANKKKKEKLL